MSVIRKAVFFLLTLTLSQFGNIIEENRALELKIEKIRLSALNYYKSENKIPETLNTVFKVYQILKNQKYKTEKEDYNRKLKFLLKKLSPESLLSLYKKGIENLKPPSTKSISEKGL